MTRTFPRSLLFVGFPIVAAAWALAIRLVWEQTFLTWERGPQMVGFALMHSGLGILLILTLYVGLLWLVIVLIAAARAKTLGGKLGAGLLISYALAWGLILTPYGFWQRISVDKYDPAQLTDLFTRAAATGDLSTVKTFLAKGVDINAQGRYGTALHGAAVEGQVEVIEYLIEHGADVNAINVYGDSPLANAMQANARAGETQQIISKHGGKIIRASEEYRNRVSGEQVRKDIEEMSKAAK